MEFDTADLASLQRNGTLDDVILHEMVRSESVFGGTSDICVRMLTLHFPLPLSSFRATCLASALFGRERVCLLAPVPTILRSLVEMQMENTQHCWAKAGLDKSLWPTLEDLERVKVIGGMKDHFDGL
jgi:hypothetical protein